MRIRSLDLIRYGHFTDTSLHFAPGGHDFHIVFGENEAGKSTTMSAIEDLLFGIPGQSPRNFLHENNALRVGATIECGGDPLSIRRRKGNKDTLLGPDDLPHAAGDGVLTPLLGGMDRGFFCRMFCLDHERLRAGGRDIIQAKDDIGATLFSAGSGVSGLRERLVAMQEEADALWASRKAGHRKYYQAEERFKEADAALRQHTVTASKWQELKSAFEDACAACLAIEKEIEEQVSELARLARVRRIYRNVRRLGEVEAEISGLGVVVALPADAGIRFERALSNNTAAEARIDAFKEQVAAIAGEKAALVIDDDVLLHEAEIESLSKRSIQLSSGRADLPKRRSELAAAEEVLKRAAIELGWTGDAGELIDRIPPRSKVSVVHALLTSRGSRFATVGSAQTAFENAGETLADIQTRLGALGPQQDFSELAGVVKSIRALGDLESRLLAIQQERSDANDQCQRLIAKMMPPVTETRLQEVKVPPEATAKTYRDRARDLETRIHHQQGVIRDLSRTVENNRNALARLVADEKIVSHADLDEQRKHRDAGWSIIKRRYIDNIPVPASDERAFTNGGDLPNTYETAVRQADVAADQRFQNAESTAGAMVLARQIAEQEDVLRSGEEELAALIGEQKASTDSWGNLWKAVTDSPLSPDEMLVWLASRVDALGQIAKRDAAQRMETSLQQQIADAKRQLVAFLNDEQVTSSAQKLPLNSILATAEIRAQREEVNSQKRNELAIDERNAKADVERKRGAVESAEKERDAWNAQWKEALAALSLSFASPVETIQEQIEAIDQMREVSIRIADLQHERIGKIERDIKAFVEDVDKLVRRISPTLVGRDADEAILKLHAQLNASRQAVALRNEKSETEQGLLTKLAECDSSRKEAEGVIAGLQRAAAVASVDALREAISRSDLQRTLKDELARLRNTLEEDGDGRPEDRLKEECHGIDLDQAAAREETLTGSLKEARDRHLAAVQSRSNAERVYSAIGGEAAAARAASDRQVALTEMKDAAAQYARVRSASLMLRWAIERFRREKQAPLLKRAGELFALLTGSSFQQLTLEYDEKDVPHLAGLREDGKAVSVSGLSEGAADQLFMALRVAAVEEYLAHATPVPFIADDLFINYDDARAAAGFKVLQQLAEKTQVLFFTHHQHLVEVARTAFGGHVATATLGPRIVPMKNVA
jgi:uncharacterized protein YhaN